MRWGGVGRIIRNIDNKRYGRMSVYRGDLSRDYFVNQVPLLGKKVKAIKVTYNIFHTIRDVIFR